MKKLKSIAKEGLDDFIQRCKSSGLKITPQRIAIYKEVLNSSKHPSADAIYSSIKKSHPHISFDTVNRTLLTFVKTGIIQIVEGSGDVRRFDPNINQHHHFYCAGCGAIMDFHDEKYDSLEIPDEIKKRFLVKKIRVVLEGYCEKCKKA
ncbi:MAG: transcriptional repressor [Thermodesulfovibrionales bacterium]|nr:transcriptional repressor [Thermodesulfovibrionales bacterium]